MEITINAENLKFQLISDIHLELRNRLSFAETGNVLILAGDIGYPENKSYGDLLARCSASYQLVLLITGNHEYYSSISMDQIDAMIRDITSHFENVLFLENQMITLKWNNGVVDIFGGTLWSETEASSAIVQKDDYRKIHMGTRLVTPKDTSELHRDAVHNLKNAISRSLEKKRELIVITHHLPSFSCIHPEFLLPHYIPSNCAYASNLDDLLKKPIKIWFHGHSHRASDKIIGETRVIATPMGYPGERSGFDPKFVVTL